MVGLSTGCVNSIVTYMRFVLPVTTNLVFWTQIIDILREFPGQACMDVLKYNTTIINERIFKGSVGMDNTISISLV